MSVGNVKRIEPSFLIEEKVDFLIIGDVVEERMIPSLEFQDWLREFSERCNNYQLLVKSISGYYINSTEINVEQHWINFFRENCFSLATHPPLLQIKMEEGGLSLEKDVLKSVKDYSKEFIEFFIKNKNRGK